MSRVEGKGVFLNGDEARQACRRSGGVDLDGSAKSRRREKRTDMEGEEI